MSEILRYKNKKDVDVALKYLQEKDSKLSFLIEKLERPIIPKQNNYFKSLVRAIVYQQLNGKVATTIFQRFEDLFSGDKFPTADEVKKKRITQLRKAGLSERKASYIKNIAEFFLSNNITTRKLNKMSDEEIKELLVQIKGVGSWTVDMFLMFTLNRCDILPVGDYGIKVGFKLLYNLDDLPDEEFMYKKTKRWRPYRTIGSTYLWALANSGMTFKELRSK